MNRFALGKRELAALLLCLAATISLHAQTFTTLLNFTGSEGTIHLVQFTDGNFYGSTSSGGTGYGTVIKITPTGTMTVLYKFCAQAGCPDGAYPQGLILGSDGKFYGTTAAGGATDNGTVFRITSAGAITTLHSFTGTDGDEPFGGLVQSPNNHFYGTTEYGGANDEGTVFEISAAGVVTSLHSFDGTDGEVPLGSLLRASDGNYYGTTKLGGANGGGTVFQITATGTLTTLYSFCAQPLCIDGEGPYGGLVQGANTNLYGTTNTGGTQGYGSVFEVTTTGTLTSLYSFCSQGEPCTDGYSPFAGLIQATDTNFYGTTSFGGANSFYGTIFSITPAGVFTTLHSFDATDGANPSAGLIQSTTGTLYGTTTQGGTSSIGTFFSLNMGLAPFVKTHPGSGKIGSAVSIVGTNLTGSSAVTFNGKAAKFTVVSNTEINATVPTGASTGKVHVKTPARTLASDAAFQISK